MDWKSLKWLPCIHRYGKEQRCRKSKRLMGELPWCRLLDVLVSPPFCAACPHREEGVDPPKEEGPERRSEEG